MTAFSANLGFLWADRSLPDAVRAAAAAGFDAVECHWPYDVDPAEVRTALAETGLPMLGLNTKRGEARVGDNGLAALPGREVEALAAIDEAIGYAAAIEARNVHVMAGVAAGDAAHRTFVENLAVACHRASRHGIGILIEPLNAYDAPGYFLSSTTQARTIIDEVGAPNLRLMFDCYHVQLSEGDLTHRLVDLLPLIGHVQFAGVPDRGDPSRGEVAYDHIFATLDGLGYRAPLGAEYKPNGPTESTLGWMNPGRLSR